MQSSNLHGEAAHTKISLPIRLQKVKLQNAQMLGTSQSRITAQVVRPCLDVIIYTRSIINLILKAFVIKTDTGQHVGHAKFVCLISKMASAVVPMVLE